LIQFYQKQKKRADLEDYVNDMRKRSQDDSLGEMFSDKEKRIIDDETEKLLEWLADNPNATEEEIEKKRLEIRKKLDPIDNKAKKRKDLSDFSADLKKRINDEEDPLSGLSSSEKRRILDDLAELNQWLADNPNATEEEIEKKKNEFDKKNKDIIDRTTTLGQFEKDIRNNRKRIDDDLGDHISSKDKKKNFRYAWWCRRLDWRTSKCKNKWNYRTKKDYDEKVNPIIKKSNCKKRFKWFIKNC